MKPPHLTSGPQRHRQRGAISLITALIFLVALSLITVAGSRVAMVQHRIAANNTRADAAFSAANAGLQAAQMYLLANRSVLASSDTGGWMSGSGSTLVWTSCVAGSTTPPCGDGSQNIYGAGWQYYGPIPNLPDLPGEYQYQAWYLSDTLNSDPAYTPYTGCLNLSLASTLPIVGPLTGAVLSSVNTVLGSMSSVLQSLLGIPLPLGLGSNICLPINFSQLPVVAPPSKVNPGIDVVAQASSASDTTGAVAHLRVTLQRISIFNHQPIAGIMAKGTVDLTGDIRIWGNPRPPTVPPNDFSLLNLNDVAGLNVTNLLGIDLNDELINLRPLLNLTSSQILALDANVTFPLSIWSESTVTLHPEPAQVNGGSLGGLLNGLGLGSLLGGLTGRVIPNPNILNGARTCLPQWAGATDSPCTALSQSLQILQGSISPATTSGGQCIDWYLSILGIKLGCKTYAPVITTPQNPPSDTSLQLKLPDIQDPQNLVSSITGLLGSGGAPTFPSDLLDYSFGYPAAQVETLKAAATVISDCSSLNADSGGFYWVTGNCTLSGNVGTAGSPGVDANPIVLITTGSTVNFAAGSTLNGVLYMYGGGTKTVTAASSPRATLRGALMVDGNLSMSQPLNVVYDQANIRAAGFLAGSFAPLAGSWSDKWSAP